KSASISLSRPPPLRCLLRFIDMTAPVLPELAAKRQWGESGSAMTAGSPAERHEKLVHEIKAHDYRYYVLDDPSVSDAEFDGLLPELRAIEKDHPSLITPDSPTQRVGGEARASVTKVRREHRMYSLDNAYSAAEMAEFHRRVVGGLAASETPLFA